MMRKQVLQIGLVLFGIAPALTFGARSTPPATQWLPSNTLLSVEIAQPKTLLKLLTDKKLADHIQAMPV